MQDSVLDGEKKRPDFYALLYRRRAPIFVALNVLAVNRRDFAPSR